MLHTLLNRLVLGLLMTISAVITLYLFLNSYEVMFNTDIPHVKALAPVSDQQIIDQLAQNQAVDVDTIKQVHNPRVLRIKNPSAKLELLPAIQQSTQRLMRTNKGHYIVLQEHPESGIGNTVIYLAKGWRTIPHPELIQENSRLFLETDHYVNMYKVIEVSRNPFGEYYLVDPLEKPYLLLVIQDQPQQVNYLIKAIFVVQEPKDST